MPFETLETVTKENRPLMACISYCRHGKKKIGKPRLTIVLPSVIAGLSKKKRFVFQVGTGADAGMGQIAACGDKDKRGVEPTNLKHSLRFSFGYVPAFGDDAAAAEHVPVRKVDDDHFLITLPPWCKVSK